MDKIMSDEIGKTSDGYHTFDELYEHRHVLYISLCKAIQKPDIKNLLGNENIVWRSKKHSDGSMYEGWFVLGVNKEEGNQVSYHLPLSFWSLTDFADTLSNAPKWDGHTPNNVLERLKLWIK